MNEDWWKALVVDPPFNLHVVRREEDASFVVGQSAKHYLREFHKVYSKSIENGLIAAVAGDPGTGKSFMIAHLRYSMKHRGQPPGIPVIVRMFGRSYSVEDLAERILGDNEFISACEKS